MGKQRADPSVHHSALWFAFGSAAWLSWTLDEQTRPVCEVQSRASRLVSALLFKVQIFTFFHGLGDETEPWMGSSKMWSHLHLHQLITVVILGYLRISLLIWD